MPSRARLLFAALLAAFSFCTSRGGVLAASDSCRDVVQEYVRFHNAHRGAAGAQYLIYECKQYCNGGLGDRVRGILFLLRVAITHRRVLLVNWTEPFPLEEVFDGAEVNWSVPPELDASSVKHFNFYQNYGTDAFNSSMRELQSLLDSGSSSSSAAALSIYTNLWIDVEVDASLLRPLARLESKHRTCWFNALFKPTARLKHEISSELSRMGVADKRSYAAAHLRLGGQEGEDIVLDRADRFEAENAVLHCARRLAAAHDLQTASPVVLVTDNRILRFVIARGYLAGVVGPSGVASHIVLGSHAHKAAFKSFVELGVLGNAACLVKSRSGFSEVAAWWSGTVCVTTVEACTAELRELTHSKGDESAG